MDEIKELNRLDIQVACAAYTETVPVAGGREHGASS